MKTEFKVKKLEWAKVFNNIEGSETVLGRYVVVSYGAGYYVSLIGCRDEVNIHETLYEAKAAAQADFERRVMECLEALPITKTQRHEIATEKLSKEND